MLSKQVAVLTEAGYVTSRRAVRDSRQRVWLSMTAADRQAFTTHVRALRAIVGG